MDPCIVNSKAENAQSELAFPVLIRVTLFNSIPLVISQVIKVEVGTVEIV